MKIVGLVSSFREGPLLASAVRSLAALDHVLVFEGPVEGNEPAGPASVIPRENRVTVIEGAWETDAAKRTAMVAWVQVFGRCLDEEGTWGLWLDGDELLLWGEYLKDWLAAAVDEAQTDAENPVIGWPLSLVEMDSSVTWCMGKLVRVDQVRRYLVSSSYLELLNGRRVTVGNVPAWTPTGGPQQFTGLQGESRPHWRARPPLQGEPHLLHRWKLRSKTRSVERQNEAEARNFEGVDL